MHPTAMHNCQAFFSCYSKSIDTATKVRVIEIGSQDVNGSLRSVVPPQYEYIGLDFVAAKGVDIILTDPYSLPFEDESVDIILSSSCFEHSEMFWLVFLEILRVLKPEGLFYLNAPSSGNFHRYPVDCWRFYPDSGRALITWAKRNGIGAAMLESYTQKGGSWQDYVAVFLKNEQLADRFPNRIIDTKTDFSNGSAHSRSEIINLSELTEDNKKFLVINQIVQGQLTIN